MLNQLTLTASFITILSFSLLAQGTPCRTEARIDQVQDQFDLSGAGVLTIMMDRGIDYRHPDFRDENGNTRIAYIFDMYDDSGAADPDNPFGFGTIYDSTEINAALVAGGDPITNDLNGHGTATTGIMSGDGSGVAEDAFRGVAHGAKIISIVVTKDFVPPFGSSSGQPGQYDPTLLPFAFEFAEMKIEELDMPSVTLLNIGSIQDPTDGSIELCSVISDFVGNGHPFVCGVGDDGGKDNHMIANLQENQISEFEIQKGEAGNLRFTAWYSEDDRVEVSIERPGGQVEGPFPAPTGPGEAVDNFLNQLFIYHRGADVEFANSSANLRQILIDLAGETGTYTIRLEATQVNSDGQMNAFLNPARYNNDNAFLNNDNPGGNINPFSACPDVISPGDYVATSSWTDVNGILRMKTGEGDPGELWLGSSVGPTMDGRLGIDFVAPGEIGWGAYGEGSYYSNFDFNVLENSDGFYGIQTAVSAAAPLTAGVIALMLEVNPELTPGEIKTILQETAREDSFTGATPNNEWGYGKLDALAAVLEASGMSGTQTDMPSTQLKVYPNPAKNQVMLNVAGDTWSVSLFSLHGKVVREYGVLRTQELDLTGLPSGVYLVRVQNGRQVLVSKVMKN
jgi:hypothetical protein